MSWIACERRRHEAQRAPGADPVAAAGGAGGIVTGHRSRRSLAGIAFGRDRGATAAPDPVGTAPAATGAGAAGGCGAGTVGRRAAGTDAQSPGRTRLAGRFLRCST